MNPKDVSSTTDDLVTSGLSSLSWARVLLLARQHGVVAALCLLMVYQMGVAAQAQSYVCGV